MTFQHQCNYQPINCPFPESRSQQSRKCSFSQPQQRSYEELQAEHSYLVSSLRLEDYKATELLKNIKSLQEDLSQANRPAYRNGKRTLGWMKQQLGETTRQEKTILGRLDQITHEMQERRRLAWIRGGGRHEQNYASIWKIKIDDRTPEFHPRSTNYFSSIVPEQNPSCSGSSCPSVHELAAELREPSTPYIFEAPPQSPPTRDTPVTSHTRPASMFEFGKPAENEKRLSMPTLSSVWAMDDNVYTYQYAGYFVSKPVQ
jgi:hypothetical protein